MIIGQMLPGGTFNGPWFPRQGDGALFLAELMACSGTLTVIAQTKNLDDADPVSATDGTILGSATDWRVSAMLAIRATDVKELVRFWYVVSSASSNWVHFRVLPPAWRKN